MQRYDVDVSDTTDRYTLNPARFWAGTAAAAVVAAVVGALIARGLFNLPVVASRSQGGSGDARTAAYAIAAASVTALAAVLMHLLTIGVAEPRRYFVWIMTLVTVIAMIIPLTLDDPLSVKIATTLVILTIGTVTTGIVHSTAIATCRPRLPGNRHAATAPTRQWTMPPAYYRAERPHLRS